ncbi:ATP-dependent DNA helicase PcrA [Clostridioides difficile]|uniref:ATP-dependent helicase n=1 Tax=Clostridioides difficile TaxID=1496 RepID=UPI001024AF25|nr:ATP-dependent helicase [Clostridioides difficile]VFF93632.1 ATP-dependent DNA helicase PcrA [Clostridioides difficile]VIG16378.1 ATP-dependent DNA helicase PcrA [Clostridioides difficile]HBF4774166.1 ATP-dependent helicase [Clostridioides difficile]HBF5038813.1 ATP-dependent helicase [Clostridioides difficile]HBF5411808.1 ATP-dependent helicase [Clostridioides difficile]
MNLLGVNEEQLKAINTNSTHVLVIAGAGAGKTNTISKRVSYLMEKRISYRNIFCITFTRYASTEMKKRIMKESKNGEKVFVSTFHMFSIYILKKYGNFKKYTMISDVEKQNLVQNIIKRFNLIKSNDLINAIKNYDIQNKNRNISLALKEYLFTLKRYRLLDIDLILPLCSELLNDEDIVSEVRDEMKHILIDEYQDSNDIQIEIIDKIAPKNLYVVGDDSQSIYEWNNSKVEYILNFEKKYSAEVIKLVKNYRNTNQIINLANRTISLNLNQIKKEMIGFRDGEDIDIILTDNQEIQNVKILSQICKYCYGIDDKNIAILCRTNMEIKKLSKIFIKYGIEFNSSIKEKDNSRLFNILTLASNLQNDLLAENILKPSEEQKIRALKENISIFESIKFDNKSEEILNFEKLNNCIKTSTAIRAYELAKKLFRIEDIVLKNKIKKWISNNTVIKQKNIGFIEYLCYENTKGGQECLKENSNNNVNLLTIHSSKGLEFDVVIIPNLYEENFPRKNENLESARRLFYVALTRAKEKVILYIPKNSEEYGKKIKNREPSILIKEIAN